MPLKEFDILAFALPFENDYPYVLRMLEQAGIPMEAGSRDDSDPLIMAGGIAVTLNPEPLSSFVDLFLLGEAEELLPEFVERYDNVLRQGKKRGNRLFAVQRGVTGVSVAALYSVLTDRNGTIPGNEP